MLRMVRTPTACRYVGRVARSLLCVARSHGIRFAHVDACSTLTHEYSKGRAIKARLLETGARPPLTSTQKRVRSYSQTESIF